MRSFSMQTAKIAFAVFLLHFFDSYLYAQARNISPQTVVTALQEGHYADALKESEELLKTEPNSAELWTLQATALERSNRQADALEAFQHAQRIAPGYLPALEGEAEIEYKAQPAKAILTLHHILVLQASNKVAHAMLGVLEYKDKQYDLASQDFAAAGRVLYTQSDSLMEWAISLARLDRHAEAAAKFHDVLDLKPENDSARYDLALEQWRSSMAEDALVTLNPLLTVQPADARALRLAAAIHESRNETPQAVELLRSAVLASPNDEANYLDFATLAFTHGSYEVGVDMINIGLAHLPNSAGLYMARGIMYGQSGDFDKALNDFEHAHRIDPTHSMAASARGIAFSQRYNHEDALQQFRQEVKEHPNDALSHYLLAEALTWELEDKHESEGPNATSEAIEMATKATQLDPNLVQAWDLLAIQLLQVGAIDRAAHACRTALAIDPKDQQALFTLIQALRKTESKEQLKGLIQQLTELKKQEQIEEKTSRYGRLTESQ